MPHDQEAPQRGGFPGLTTAGPPCRLPCEGPAERISERLGVVAISTGRHLPRQRQGGDAAGRRGQDVHGRGGLRPGQRHQQDGPRPSRRGRRRAGLPAGRLPRTTEQVDYLDAILADGDQKLDVVLQLTADDEELVKRLLGRAKETGRSDDNEAVIRHRLDLYHEQTEPVVAEYAERGILTQVDGIGGIDEVTERVMEAIKASQTA
ncbi:adenylate kinase family protein [Arthrobacter sp. TE12232]